jgi:hypothetical protein
MKERYYERDYALLSEDKEHNLAKNKEITDILYDCALKLLAIEDSHGIGDTATDEEIADQFYSILHYEL